MTGSTTVPTPKAKPTTEIAMTARTDKPRSGLVRWFKKFSERNRSPHRWYEYDHFGI